MSHIRKITIEGFRSIKSIKDLELRPLNVLIGANGSGKSSFLNAFYLLREFVINSGTFPVIVDQLGGASRLLHFGPKTTPTMRFNFQFVSEIPEFSAIMNYGSDDRLSPLLKFGEDLVPDYRQREQVSSNDKPTIDYIREIVEGWLEYQFHDTGLFSPMKTLGDVDNNRQLDRIGSNLAPILYLLQAKHSGDYASIRHAVQLAAPFFEDFVLMPTAHNNEKIRLEWKHEGTDDYFSASSLSGGTLRFAALATLLLQPISMRPSVILLDEPELGLHPYAIELLAAMLKQASIETQIILATQSPILVDYFEPEDVIVADRVAGATKLNRLEADRLAVWLEDYSLGELWEKNYLGGRPAPESSEDTQGE